MKASAWWWGSLSLSVLLTSGAAKARDPQFGDPLPGLTPDEMTKFEAGRAFFAEEETAADGLGPVFNGVSCVSCHGAAAPGGGRAASGGPSVVETRFGHLANDGTFDPLVERGGSLIQTTGIGPAGTCNFVGEVVPPEANVTAGRRTTPLFGLGLVDAVPDATFLTLAANQQGDPDGVRGRASIVHSPNANANLVGKFGWKAQVASLRDFAGDAYLNEMGITSVNFPKDNCPQGDCASLLACDPRPDDPEDATDTDVQGFADFMTLLGPPPRGKITGQVNNGEAVFHAIRCDACHVASLTTGPSAVAALRNVTFAPYSDFLLHNMGALGDRITQNQAAGTDMRTAPLWGLRDSTRYLHDGRALTLPDAITAHDGEARAARDRFIGLTQGDKNKLLAFLSSL
jgi:CxxC motif-containing protein (DUF1111 family)